MSKSVVYGGGKRFWVESDWYQPQDTAYRLKDGDKTILEVDENNKDVGRNELKSLCDLLNQLADAPAALTAPDPEQL